MSAGFEEQSIYVKFSIIANSLLSNDPCVSTLFIDTVNTHIPYKFYFNYDCTSFELVLDPRYGIGGSFIQGNVLLSY